MTRIYIPRNKIQQITDMLHDHLEELDQGSSYSYAVYEIIKYLKKKLEEYYGI